MHVDDPHQSLPDLPLGRRAERLYVMLLGVFLGALVMTNAIAGKFFLLRLPFLDGLFGSEVRLGLSCGVIAYPVTFLVTDVVSEVFGLARARQVVRVGFVVSVFVTALVWIATKVPIDGNSPVTQEAFGQVFGLLPGIVFGSMVAYLSAQFVDVHVFEFWRGLTRGKHLWLRNNGSTVVSQLVDTVLVVTIALVVWPRVDGNELTQPIAWDTWRAYVVGQYLFKATIALVDTPLFYLAAHRARVWIANDPLG